jgi:hypothetical protein
MTTNFLIGELGGKYLISELSSATNPFKVIESFRDNNGIRYPEDKFYIFNFG